MVLVQLGWRVGWPDDACAFQWERDRRSQMCQWKHLRFLIRVPIHFIFQVQTSFCFQCLNLKREYTRTRRFVYVLRIQSLLHSDKVCHCHCMAVSSGAVSLFSVWHAQTLPAFQVTAQDSPLLCLLLLTFSNVASLLRVNVCGGECVCVCVCVCSQ